MTSTVGRVGASQRAAIPEYPRCLLSELGSCMLLGAWQGAGMRSSQGQDQVSKGPLGCVERMGLYP